MGFKDLKLQRHDTDDAQLTVFRQQCGLGLFSQERGNLAMPTRGHPPPQRSIRPRIHPNLELRRSATQSKAMIAARATVHDILKTKSLVGESEGYCAPDRRVKLLLGHSSGILEDSAFPRWDNHGSYSGDLSLASFQGINCKIIRFQVFQVIDWLNTPIEN